MVRDTGQGDSGVDSLQLLSSQSQGESCVVPWSIRESSRSKIPQELRLTQDDLENGHLSFRVEEPEGFGREHSGFIRRQSVSLLSWIFRFICFVDAFMGTPPCGLATRPR